MPGHRRRPPRDAARAGAGVRWPATTSPRHPRHVLLFAVAAGLLARPAVPPRPAVVHALPSRRSPRSRLAAAVSSLAAAATAVLAGAVVADLRLVGARGRPRCRACTAARSRRAPSLLEPVRVRARRAADAFGRAACSTGARRATSRSCACGLPRILAHGRAWARSWPSRGASRHSGGSTRSSAAAARSRRSRSSRLRATGERRGGPARGCRRRAPARARTGSAVGSPSPRRRCCAGWCSARTSSSRDDVRDDFKRSGLAHVLAVSGQNVMLLATLVLARGRAVGAPLRARLVVALALVALYVPLTGAGPVDPARRRHGRGRASSRRSRAGPRTAGTRSGSRRRSRSRVNPGAAGEPGWQLSFAAVVALLALAPPLRGRLARCDARAGRGRRGDDRGRHGRHRATDGAALRAGLDRGAAREPARGPRDRAGHVARDARRRRGPDRARARRSRSTSSTSRCWRSSNGWRARWPTCPRR